ncbi:MAG: F0F1 ATP synthase subunit delta [Candidatus Omnitrophota bacterium]
MVIQLVFFQILTFAVIVAVLHLFFGTQLKIALKRLQVLHQESLEKEEILNKEIERAKAQAQSEIARSKEEARYIIDEAKKKAEHVIEESAGNAQEEAKKIMAESLEHAKKRESEILACVDQKAVVLATELIRYTFAQKDKLMLHTQMIDALIEEFKKIDQAKFSIKTSEVVVTTPVALNEQEKKNLKEAIEEKMGNSVVLEEVVDEALVAGLIVQLGGLVVDGSIKNKFNKVMQFLRTK